MSVTAAAVQSGRRLAEALMTATATVYRRTGERRDGIRVVAQWSVAYAGRCKVQTYEGYEQTPGGSSGATARYTSSMTRTAAPTWAAGPAGGARQR